MPESARVMTVLGEDFPVAECLRIVLNEEWEHRLYAERDLAVLGS